MAQIPGSAASQPGGQYEPSRVPGAAGADRHWLRQAIELSKRCPPSDSAFSVGAVLVSGTGAVIATGFSRECDPADHAEEVALARAAEAAADRPGGVVRPGGVARPGDVVRPGGDPSTGGPLAGATIYSSLEPCLRRASRPRSCAELIVAAGLRRVVLAWREPPLFVPGGGAEWLRARDVAVIEIPELTAQARAVNAHLFSR
jgi:diaminohydroxyphosphoribosylaminopyrimidine deaminase / 5-amino-6-(5-phosphoribosylamino)uracil reductase